jgi:hypothetical protein
MMASKENYTIKRCNAQKTSWEKFNNTYMGLLVELETCFMPIIVSEIK